MLYHLIASQLQNHPSLLAGHLFCLRCLKLHHWRVPKGRCGRRGLLFLILACFHPCWPTAAMAMCVALGGVYFLAGFLCQSGLLFSACQLLPVYTVVEIFLLASPGLWLCACQAHFASTPAVDFQLVRPVCHSVFSLRLLGHPVGCSQVARHLQFLTQPWPAVHAPTLAHFKP